VTVQGVFTVDGWRSAGTTTIDGGQITADTITANQIAAGTITATEITAGTITGDKIAVNTIDADSLKTSTLNAKTITLGTTGGDAIIKSGNYSSGAAGWQIEANGNAEFNNVIVRGTLGTSTIGVGETITISGDIKTSDGKFEIKTTGIILKQSAADNTYISLIQDTAQIQLYSVGVQRVLVTPRGTISLTTDAGVPLSISSSSDADCISVTTSQNNRRGIVLTTNPNSSSSGASTIYAVNNATDGYALYAGGKVHIAKELYMDGGRITIQHGVSGLNGLSISTIPGSSSTSAASIHVTNSTSFGYAIYASGNVQMNGNVEIGSTLRSISGSLLIGSNISMGSYDISCRDIGCRNISSTGWISATGQISGGSLKSTGGYIYFNAEETSYLRSYGGDIYWRKDGVDYKLNP
jgi:hypothetical protein